ncbi:MAG: polysaccharide biosynthesis tyrosine autokinase [Lentisphaerae bacterium]|nr:polysaccharide biosynthesis tyrosine autokinase [Lentisphaerota bacterium]
MPQIPQSEPTGFVSGADGRDDGSIFLGGHLWDHVQVLVSRWPIAAAAFLSVFVIAAAYTWTRVPMYRAEAEVMIEASRVDLSGLQDARNAAEAIRMTQQDIVETQVNLIRSTSILESALSAGGLLLLPEFAAAADPVKLLRLTLDVSSVRRTALIKVAVMHANAGNAARIVNAVVDAYESGEASRKTTVSDRGLAELRAKAEQLRVKLEAESRQLHEFMADHEMVSLEKSQNIVVARLVELNSKLAEVEPARLAKQSKVETARAAVEGGQSVDAIPEVLASAIIQTLKTDLAKLEQEYAQLLPRFGESHPQLQAVANQIGALQTKLARESSAIIASMENEYDQAVREEQLLRTALKEQEGRVMNFNSLSARYDMLKQSLNSAQQAYETIMRRIEEIDINRMTDQGKMSFVVSRASKPAKPSWPRKGRNIAVGVLLGAMLSVGLAFFVDYMDTTVRDEETVKRTFNCALVGHVPRIGHSDENRLVGADQGDAHAAEAFRLLRTSLFYCAASVPMSQPLKSFVVSSTMPKEGKTLVAANLAASLALVGRKTLLVDGDMRRPSVKRMLPSSFKQGLSELLDGQHDTDAVAYVQETSLPNLHVLYAGVIPKNPVELLDTARFGALLRDLESKYEHVIIDAPPAGGLSDAIVMGRRTFGLLLVIRSFVTQRGAMEHLAAKLSEAQVPVVGAVVNDLNVPAQAYGYYAYSRHYRKYYVGSSAEA